MNLENAWHYPLFLVFVLMVGCDSGVDATFSEDDGGDSPLPDAGAPDAGAPFEALWEWCPSADAYRGDEDWAWSVAVGGDAFYCGAPADADMDDPDGSLVQEMARKMRIRFVPGTYPLPAPGENSGEVSLPLCFDRGDAEVSYAVDGVGTVTIESHSGLVGDFTHEEMIDKHRLSQSLSSPDIGEATLTLELESVDYTPADPMRMILDGRYAHTYLTEDRPTFVRLTMNAGGTGYRPFYPCKFFERPETERLTTFVFSAGEVSFDMDIYTDLPEFCDTEPSAFVRAVGTFKGESFDQRDFWKLVYSPSHHHFSRSWAVLFDAPIEGACGLKVINFDLDGLHSEGPAVVSTIDCDLTTIETLELAE